MGKADGHVVITVSGNTEPFEKDMKRARESVGAFEKRFGMMGANIARIGANVAASTAVIATGAAALASSAVSYGAELEKLSRLSNSTPEQFQKMARAAGTVGVSQEKLADVLKDTSDKLGDFAATGGGPLKDFFEKVAPQVGVTADMFRDLSAPDALQLYVDTLERAGTPQQEMVFHLENMANDLTVLLPLLKNGGAEIARLGEQADEAGAILSNEAVQGASDLKAEMGLLSDAMSTTLHSAFLENKEEIKAIVDLINSTLIPALSSLVSLLGSVAQGYEAWGEAFHAMRQKMGMGFEAIEPGSLPPVSITPGSGSIADQFGGNGNSPIQNLFGGANSSEVAGGEGGDQLGLGSPEAQQEVYETSLNNLREFFSSRLSLINEQAAQELVIADQSALGIAETEAAKYQNGLDGAKSFFGSLETISKSGNENMLKASKAFGAAQALISAWEGAAKALTLPFPSNLAAYAQVLATGLGAVNSIKGVTAGGGSSGGSAGAAVPQAVAQAPLQVQLNGLTEDALFSGGFFGRLLEGLQDEAGDRGLIFT